MPCECVTNVALKLLFCRILMLACHKCSVNEAPHIKENFHSGSCEHPSSCLDLQASLSRRYMQQHHCMHAYAYLQLRARAPFSPAHCVCHSQGLHAGWRHALASTSHQQACHTLQV